MMKPPLLFLKRSMLRWAFLSGPGSRREQVGQRAPAGICNAKAVAVSVADGDDAPGVAVTRKTKKGGFATSVHKGANPRKVAEKVGKEVASYRPDLAEQARVGASLAFAASKRGPGGEDDE